MWPGLIFNSGACGGWHSLLVLICGTDGVTRSIISNPRTGTVVVDLPDGLGQ